MTIDEFRSHKYLPQQWRKEIETNGILRLVMEVMEQNHPARFNVDGDVNGDVSPTQAAIQLGETRGYSKYSNGLKILAQRKQPRTGPGEPTYQPEEKREDATSRF